MNWLAENISWRYSILSYIHVVFAYWWAIVPGVLLPLLDVSKVFKTRLPEIPRSLEVAAFVFFLSIAQFLTFRNAQINLASIIEDKRQLSVEINAQSSKNSEQKDQLAILGQQLAAVDQPEPRDSLRHRTMQLAARVETYLVTRAANSPPFAGPDSSVPNPTDEQKKAIEKYRAYWQETADYYSEHFKEAMVGIVREYAAKGVRTGYMESTFSQRPPYVCPPPSACENTPTDELYQFRELTYHVDAQGHLITITP